MSETTTYIDKIKLTADGAESSSSYEIHDAVRNNSEKDFMIEGTLTTKGKITCNSTITSTNIQLDKDKNLTIQADDNSGKLLISSSSISIGANNTIGTTGTENTTNHQSVILIGNNLVSHNDHHFAVGQYNKSDHSAGINILFEIGDGAASNGRSPFIVDRAGNGNGSNDMYRCMLQNCFQLEASIANPRYSFKYENQNGELSISAISNPTSTSSFRYNTNNNTLLIGQGLTSISNNQVIFGKYNEAINELLFSIGNGDDNDNRKNIIEVSSTQLKVNGFIDCISPTFSTDTTTNKTSSTAGVRRIMIGESAPGENIVDGIGVGDIYMWVAPATATQLSTTVQAMANKVTEMEDAITSLTTELDNLKDPNEEGTT